ANESLEMLFPIRRDGGRADFPKRRQVSRIQNTGSVRPRRRQAASQELSKRQPLVLGPTPPGTGVIAPATALTEAKSTSPTIRLRPSGSAAGLIPTSVTVAPRLPQSADPTPGRPSAAMSLSARRQI